MTGQTVVYKKKFLIARFGTEVPMNTIGIYEVFAVYAENPQDPIVFRPKVNFSFGADEDEAVMRSGIYLVLAAAKKEPSTATLDPRYITIIARHLGDAKTPPQS